MADGVPQWTTACPDWEDRFMQGRSLLPCGPLFPEEAEAALEVFKAFRVVDVQGAPTVGEIARPWILDFAATFFGSYNQETGQRLIQTYFLKVPKKNWKSGITAFLMGTLLIRNWRESGEFGIIAPTTEIANNAFGPLKHAIRKDEELSDLLHIQDHIRTITHRTTKAALQVVAAESDTLGGKKFIVTLVEELWQFGKRANADAMLLEATGGMASRAEGAAIYITTESDEAPAGVYAAKNLYARKVRDGKIVDPSFLPLMYEWPQAMLKSKACFDLANAGMVNPNLGASVSREFLRSKYEQSKAESPKAFQAFVAKHLDIEIGVALNSDRWAGADFWERQGTNGLDLNEIIRRSEVLVFGVDGGGLDDLLAGCVIGREAVTGNWLIWTHAWVYRGALDLRKEIAPRLLDFEADGDLTVVDKITDAFEQMADIVEKSEESGLLDRIGLDQAGVDKIVEAIEARGLKRERFVAVPQGWKLQSAILSAEVRLAEGTLFHGDQRMMQWVMGNMKVEPRGNAVMITKQVSGRSKIDPGLAMFDAVALMSMNPQPRTRKHQLLFF